MNALRPKPGSNLQESQPPTPERKRLQYSAEASPTTGERRENLVDELFVPIPEGVGRQDLDDLSELLEDPSLAAEDLAEILETLGASSAQQARLESWATSDSAECNLQSTESEVRSSDFDREVVLRRV